MKLPTTTKNLLRLLHTRFTPAAVELICKGGVFAFSHDGRGPSHVIEEIEGKAHPALAFEQYRDRMKLKAEVENDLSDTVYGALAEREEVAYLLGFAVGSCIPVGRALALVEQKRRGARA